VDGAGHTNLSLVQDKTQGKKKSAMWSGAVTLVTRSLLSAITAAFFRCY
jgi:hypothetical protein